MARIRLSIAARSDLRAYRRWLTREAGKTIAEEWAVALNAWIKELRTSPERGTPKPDLGAKVRTRVYRRTVMMAYLVEADEVVVLRVLGRGRDITAEMMIDQK